MVRSSSHYFPASDPSMRKNCLEREKLAVLLITISRRLWRLATTGPADDCERGGVDHDDETENAEKNICCLAEAGLCYAFEVEHWLRNISSFATSKT